MRVFVLVGFLLIAGTWSLAQTVPPPLPHTVIDSLCCPYPRLRFGQGGALATAESLPGSRERYYLDLRALVLILNGLERSPRPTAEQLGNVHTYLWNLGRALGGRYNLRPWYQELHAHRRRLKADQEALYREDSIGRDTADRITDSLEADYLRRKAYAEGRRRERDSALGTMGPVKLWGWTCGPDGRTVHYHRDCPAWLLCPREPVNIELERMRVTQRELCGWCVVFGWPATTPYGRDE
jgi:hypothetical protein